VIHTFGRICNRYRAELAGSQARIWGSGEGAQPISTAPAVEPAMIERRALGLSLVFSGALACCALDILKIRGGGKGTALRFNLNDAVTGACRGVLSERQIFS
jgi:hypothetical protein